MSKKTIYCDQCKFLEQHGIFSEEADECGRFDELGTQYYCRFHKRYFDFEVNEKTVGHCACAYGVERNRK